MSYIGLANVYMLKNSTHTWVSTWPDPEWPGNVIYQPQSQNAFGSMTCTAPAISMNNNFTYSFEFTIANNSPEPTYYNIQVSTS